MAVILNNKEIDINSIQIEDVQMFDYPDFVDAFIAFANYTDGTDLTIDECIELEYQEEGLVNQLIHENSLYI